MNPRRDVSGRTKGRFWPSGLSLYPLDYSPLLRRFHERNKEKANLRCETETRNTTAAALSEGQGTKECLVQPENHPRGENASFSCLTVNASVKRRTREKTDRANCSNDFRNVPDRIAGGSVRFTRYTCVREVNFVPSTPSTNFLKERVKRRKEIRKGLDPSANARV